MLILRLITQAISMLILVSGQTPPTLPPTNSVEMPMIYGHEVEEGKGSCNCNVATDQTPWVVPYKFYRLSKVKMWLENDSNAYGFEATFSAPAEFVGWADITHMFGFTDNSAVIQEIWLNSEVVSMEICHPNTSSSDTDDFEGFRFTEEDATFQ